MKTEIPRNATGQGKGGVLVPFCLIILVKLNGIVFTPSPLCCVSDIGEGLGYTRKITINYRVNLYNIYKIVYYK